MINKDYFSNLDKNSCYWAGFIAADGCLYERYKQLSFDLKVDDYAHLLKFCAYTETDSKVLVVYRKDKKIWASQLYIRGAESWIRDLKDNFNITPRKSLTLSPHQDYVT